MTPLILTFVLVVLVDQASKYYIRQAMQLHASIDVMGDVLRITYIQNPGAAFGISIGSRWVFLILSLIACLGVIYYFYRIPVSERWGRFALILVLAGAVGNLIDRIHAGEVTDFIDIGIGIYRWPIFNVADMAVTTGVILLFIRMSSSRQKAAEPPRIEHHRALNHREDRPA